jgi:ADP-heptose:LPS heptosyltransferase
MVTHTLAEEMRLPAAPRRIAIYMMLPIGDTIFAMPTLAAIREHYPRSRLTAVVRAQTAPLVQQVPGIDDLLVIRSTASRRSSYLHLARQLRQSRPDLAVNLTSPVFRWLSLYAGIRHTASMKFETLWWIWPRDQVSWNAKHTAEHLYGCASELDLPAWAQVDHVPRFDLPSSAMDRARGFLAARLGRGVPGRLVGIHAGGDWLGGLKRWPIEHYRALCQALTGNRQATIVLLGDDRDRRLKASLAVGLPGRCLDASGALDLMSACALISCLDLFIGNDSGLLHAAAALGTPYVGVYGPTALASFAPLSPYPGQGVCLSPEVPCRTPRHFIGGETVWYRHCCQGTCTALADLPPRNVLAAVDRLLARSHVSQEASLSWQQ